MKKELTALQKARFPEFIEKWTNIGLSTKPANRRSAEDAIRKIYKASNLVPPEVVIWSESPFGMYLCNTLFSDANDGLKNMKGGANAPPVSDKQWNTAIGLVWGNIQRPIVTAVNNDPLKFFSIFKNISFSPEKSEIVVDECIKSADHYFSIEHPEIQNSLSGLAYNAKRLLVSSYASVSPEFAVDYLANMVLYDMFNTMVTITSAEFHQNMRDGVWNSIFGSHEAAWLAVYDYLSIVCGLEEETKPLEGMVQLGQNCGWILPCEDVCFASERHSGILFDEGNRLHADGAPACEYPDGFGIWVYHGARLPKKYHVHSSRWKPEWFVSEENAELRQILADGIGIERIATELDWDTLSTHNEYRLMGDDEFRFLEMKCPSTGKMHYGRVPPEIETAYSAIIWRNRGIPPNAFGVQQ